MTAESTPEENRHSASVERESTTEPTETRATLQERLAVAREVRKTQEKRPMPEGVSGAGKQIRKFCLECVGGPGGPAVSLVRACTGFTCPLWSWRFGKSPQTLRDENLLKPEYVRGLA